MSISVIEGEVFTDERGKLGFFNKLNMSEIVRFYEITPSNEQIIRGWQAHKKENKWFYCIAGSFVIYVVKIDDFNNPSKNCVKQKILLNSNEPKILYISGGYASGFRAKEKNSRMQVFSNFDLEKSKQDDFRYSIDKWQINWDE